MERFADRHKVSNRWPHNKNGQFPLQPDAARTPRGECDELFRQAHTLAFPTALTERDHSRVKHWKMGLFPEICRAWIVLDTKLYLWNYHPPRDAEGDGVQEVPLGGANETVVAAAT